MRHEQRAAGQKICVVVTILSSLIWACTSPPANGDPNRSTAWDEVTGLAAAGNANTVVLSWDGPSDATSYQVRRDDEPVGIATSNRFVDNTTSRGQAYTYSVAALGPEGASPTASIVTNGPLEDGSRSWLTSKYGPALCARTEASGIRGLVCTVRTRHGWKQFATKVPVDWGYANNRAWLTVAGKINYCGTVGDDQVGYRVTCLRLGAHRWGRQSISMPNDWGDSENRTWLPSRYGPALCGRTEAAGYRSLVCTVRTRSGWKQLETKIGVDWGYPYNRAWLTVAGKINYCGMVGGHEAGDRLACVRLGAHRWGKQSISEPTEWGVPENRTWVASRSGPALCARTEASGVRGLVCTVRTRHGWKQFATEVPVDWGYFNNRAWLTDAGKINYCGMVGDDQAGYRVACLRLGAHRWGEQSVSMPNDWGESEDRTWLSSRYGPALCGRTEAAGYRSLVCTVRTRSGWKQFAAKAGVDWGYDDNRSWLVVAGKVHYCGLVGGGEAGARVACLRLGAHRWGRQAISEPTEWGYLTNTS